MSDIPPPPPPPSSGPSPARPASTPSMTGPVVTLVIGSIAVFLGLMIGTGPYKGAYPDEDYIVTLHNFMRLIAWFLLIVGGILVIVGVILMISRGTSGGGVMSSDAFGAALPGTGVTVPPTQGVKFVPVAFEDTPESKRRRQLAGVLQMMQGGILLLMEVMTVPEFLYFPGIIMWQTTMRALGVFLVLTGYRCYAGRSWGRRSVCWLQFWFLVSLSPSSISYATRGAIISYAVFAATFVLAVLGRPKAGAPSLADGP